MHLLDVNGPAHIFHEAKEHGAAVELYYISLNEASEAQSSAGLSFSGLVPFHYHQLKAGDILFIPGLEYKLLSDFQFLEEAKPFLEWTKVQYLHGAQICSVCTGAFLLAETGILQGKSCTTHWKFFSIFNQKFPKIKLHKNRLFVKNDNIYTSAGVSSGIDLALFILEEAYGAKFALDVAKEVVIYFRRSGTDPQLSIFLQHRNHLEDRVHHAQDFIAQNISKKLTIQDLADHVNTSPRNLTRLFKNTTGITIGAYLDKIRSERALQLSREGNKLNFIAQECGLKSTNQLRALLKKHKNGHSGLMEQ